MAFFPKLTKSIKRRIAIGFLSFLLVIFLWPAAVVQTQFGKEIRATWMTHLGVSLMYHTTRLDNTIAHLAKEKINTLYPAVWNHGHTLYPSAVIQQYGGSTDRNPWIHLPISGDLMAGLVTQSHRQHLRLIPWFEYGLMIPLDAALVKQHPDWLTRKLDQTLTDDPKTNSKHPLGAISLAVKGDQQVWLNPFHPEVQQFFIEMITEVVRKYDVDGIQLDDHFGLPIEYGYDPYTLALYRREHNGQMPPKQSADEPWIKWRADKLTQFMADIHQAIKAVRPDARVSLSPNAPEFAYRKYLQNWPQWVEKGLLDEVVVQLYRPNLTSLKAELDRPNLKSLATKVTLAVGLYTGPFRNAKSAQQVQQEAAAVKSAGYAGTSFFCWETTFWWFRGK